MAETQTWPVASVEARLETADGVSVLTYDKLDTQQIIASVGDDQAGATAVFIGTTRDSFKGADSAWGTASVLTVQVVQRQSRNAARLPGVQQIGHQDHGKYPPRDSCTILTIYTRRSGLDALDNQVRRTPSPWYSPCRRTLNCHRSLVPSSQRKLCGVRIHSGGGEAQGANMEERVLRGGKRGGCGMERKCYHIDGRTIQHYAKV